MPEVRSCWKDLGMAIVHRFSLAVQGGDDGYVRSCRWGTIEGIRQLGDARLIVNSGIEVPDADIGREVPGLTSRDYEPRQGVVGAGFDHEPAYEAAS